MKLTRNCKKGIPIRINKGTEKERVVGTQYSKEKLFVKEVYESRHLFRILDAWGLDSDYFTNVLLPNNYTIQIKDRETKKTYTIKAEKLKKKGLYYHFKKQDNYGSQIFCPRRFWELPKKKTKVEEAKEFSELYLR